VARQTARVLGQEVGPPEGGHHVASANSPGTSKGHITFYSSGDLAEARRVTGLLLRQNVDIVHPLPV